MAKIVEKPALLAYHLGDPKAVMKLSGENARHFMGVVFGIARKTRPKITIDKAGNSHAYDQIIGDFAGVPADKDATECDEIRSSVLYLPDNIHAGFAKVLDKEDAEPIKFAVELYTIKNGKAFSWEAKALFPPVVADPLTEIRESITGKSKALVADAQRSSKK